MSTTFVTCPAEASQTLGIKMPFLVMIIKNMRKYFSFEVQARRCAESTAAALAAADARAAAARQVIDDKGIKRRFRASNFQARRARWPHAGMPRQRPDAASALNAQSATRVKPFICTMPMRLDEGWNQIQFNLADFCKRAYGTGYVETLRVQVHCSCRVRRIYFSDRLYAEEELPAEFKLFVPLRGKAAAAAAAAAAAPAGDEDDDGEGVAYEADEGAPHSRVGTYGQQGLGDAIEYEE